MLVPDCGFSQTARWATTAKLGALVAGRDLVLGRGRLTDPTDLGVIGAAAAIRSGALTSTDLVDACLARIAATDADVRAWVVVDADGARAAATACDEAVTAGRPLGALHGVPIGIKDIIDVAGLPTRAGAAAFAHAVPARDATLVGRLRAAGAVILGKTETTEFAFSDPAPTRNPWASDRTPGGSSSGSAATVAARQVPAAIGTQTGGSILRPAAYCGVVGLKGAYGAVPLDGVRTLAASLDHAGPLARSVADAAILEDVLAGTASTVATIARPRIAIVPELMAEADPDLRAHLAGIIARLADAGAVIDEIALPSPFARIVAATRLIMSVEAAATHASTFAVHGDAYGPGIAALVRTGQAQRPVDLDRAERDRASFRTGMAPLLAAHDALLSPVAPGPAPDRRMGTGDLALCAPWSCIGVPAIAIPTGLDASGLPWSVQLVGGADDIGRLLGDRGLVCGRGRVRRATIARLAARAQERGGAVLSRTTSSVASSTRVCAGCSPAGHGQDELGGGHGHLERAAGGSSSAADRPSARPAGRRTRRR